MTRRALSLGAGSGAGRFLCAALAAQDKTRADLKNPAAPQNEIRSGLKGNIAAERQEAALALGRAGEMKDTPSLAPLLADSEVEVREAAYESLWKIWLRSGDPKIDALMSRGVELMNGGHPAEAVDVFSEIIHWKPGYAEGWNKRATALWMVRRYRESIADCIKVVELNPYHFGAFSGMGLNYLGLDDFEGALEASKKTITLLPHSKSAARYIEIIETALADKRRKI